MYRAGLKCIPFFGIPFYNVAVSNQGDIIFVSCEKKLKKNNKKFVFHVKHYYFCGKVGKG